MRKIILTALNTLMLVSVAAVAFAADGGISGGFGLAAAGGACGQGSAIKAACEGVARNPDASGKISQSLILGLAFIESLVIYALLVSLILLFVKM
jgi:F-type H+-transporting ATPase subunit c